MSDRCLICGKHFADVGRSEEHVIPNAMGGRLKTYEATCRPCNSQAGHSSDLDLVRKFHPFLNALDVVRERGKHQLYEFEDKDSEETYVIPPGATATRATDFKAVKLGDVLQFGFYASTREEAEAILKKKLGKRAKEAELTWTVKPGRTYSWSVSVAKSDVSVLRAIARIVAYYARHVGVEVEPESDIVAFIVGRSSAPNLIAPVRSDVIAFLQPKERDLCHAVFVSRESPEDSVLGYVSLFGCFEFVVDLGKVSAPSSILRGHYLNLVNSESESRGIDWVLTGHRARRWFRNPIHCIERFRERMVPLEFYLSHPNELWVERAAWFALRAYFVMIDQGADVEAAHTAAIDAGNRYLQKYGLVMNEFNTSPEGLGGAKS